MADNTVLNAGSAGDTLATDDIAGVKHQRVKVQHGADGSATDVSTASPLPAILGANSGVDIGDVDVLSLIPGSGATNLGKAIDAIAGASDVGVAALAVRDDALTTLTPIDGDYAPLRLNATGALWVHSADLATLAGAVGGTEFQVDVITVPAPLNVVGGGVEATALRVTLASDSTGLLSVDDNAGSLTVDNAALSVTGGGVEATALRVTLASDTTGVLSIDDNAGSLTVDNAGITTIAGAVAGTEMQVDVVAALPAGTNAIGKLAPNTGVDIGDVDVTSLIPGSGATNLGKAIDAVAGASDVGVAALAIRDDALTTLTPIDGDWVPLRVNSTGALHVTGAGGGVQFNVDDVAGATDTGTLVLAIRDDALTTLTPIDGDYVGLRVSSTGALHVTGGGGGTEYTEDVATANPIVGTATMMERDDALGTLTPIEGDWAALRCSATGALWVALDTSALAIGKLAANTGVDIGDVDVTSIIPGTGATNLGKIEDAAHTTGDVGVMALTVRRDADTTLAGTTGDYAPLQVDANGYLKVEIFDGGGSHTVDNNGTFAVQVDGAALTALQLIDNAIVVEDVAAAADPSGNMMMAVRDDEVGATAVTSADGDVTSLRTDKFGALKTTQIADATSEIKYAVIDHATSGDQTLVASAGNGKKIRVLSLFMIATGTVVARLGSGAGLTTASSITGNMSLVANSGFVLPYNPGGWFETADNQQLNLNLSAAISVDGALSYVEV